MARCGMNTRELIAALQEADPSGSLPVYIHTNDDVTDAYFSDTGIDHVQLSVDCYCGYSI